jgi:hypothetical protein
MASSSRAAIAVALLALAAAAAAAPAAAAPAAAAPALALTQVQADALVGVWELQSGLDLSGHRFDTALKAAVAAGAPVDLGAVFEEAAVEITAITIALVYVDPATGIIVGYAVNTTANATASYVPIAPLKRYVGHAAPAPGGVIAFTLVQDDDQGTWRGEVGPDGVMRVLREEGVEVWAPGGGALVDNMAATTLTLARSSTDTARALESIAPFLPLKKNVLVADQFVSQATSGTAARRGLAAAAAAAALAALTA